MARKRIIELDIFRGLAAFIVVLFHYTYKYEEIFESHVMDFYIFNYGHYGVQLFFIISGFVIFMTVERSKSHMDFLKRRFIRLYPTFWLCMLFTFAVTSFAEIPRFERSLSDLLANFTMIPGILGYKSIDGVYWSLQVELIFYGIMFLVLLLKQIKNIVLILYMWFAIGWLDFLFQIRFLNVFFITEHCNLFIAGIAFYKIWKDEIRGFSKYHILILISLMYGFAKNVESGLVTFTFFCLFFMLIYGKISFLSSLRMSKLALFLGKISYALYLIHQFIGLILIYYLSEYVQNYFLLLIIPIGINIFLAWLITDKFESTVQLKLNSLMLK